MTSDDATDHGAPTDGHTGPTDGHGAHPPFDDIDRADVDPTDVELPVPDEADPGALDDDAQAFDDDLAPDVRPSEGDPTDLDDLDDLDDLEGGALRLDGDGDDADDGPTDPPAGSRAADIDLTLDGDDAIDPATDDASASDPGGRDDEYAVAGVVGTAPLADWAADALPAGVDHDAVVAEVARLGLDPGDLGPREVVHVLERLGADAWMDHGSVDSLAELLARGGRCQLVDGSDRFEVVAVDDRTDELVVRDLASGATVHLALDAFEDAWSASAFAQLTPAGDDPVVMITAHVAAGRDDVS